MFTVQIATKEYTISTMEEGRDLMLAKTKRASRMGKNWGLVRCDGIPVAMFSANGVLWGTVEIRPGSFTTNWRQESLLALPII